MHYLVSPLDKWTQKSSHLLGVWWTLFPWGRRVGFVFCLYNKGTSSFPQTAQHGVTEVSSFLLIGQ